MSQLTAYELHTYRDGRWKIDSIYDDKRLALYEAKRLHEGAAYSGVRVSEEQFDPQTGEIKARTIFRATKSAPREPTESEKLEVKAQRAAQSRKKPPDVDFKKDRARRDAPVREAVGLTLKLGAIVLAGIGVLLALRYMATL